MRAGKHIFCEKPLALNEALFKTVDATWYFFARQEAEFVEAIREGRQPAVSGADGRETVRLIEAIYDSGRKGLPVALA